MEWHIVLGAWVGVIGLIFSLAGLLRTGSVVRDETKELLRGLLTESDPGVWVQATSRAFLHIFDRVYRGQGTLIEQIAINNTSLFAGFVLGFPYFGGSKNGWTAFLVCFAIIAIVITIVISILFGEIPDTIVIMGIVILAITGIGFVMVFIGADDIPVRPIRGIASALIFLIIVGVFRMDAARFNLGNTGLLHFRVGGDGQ